MDFLRNTIFASSTLSIVKDKLCRALGPWKKVAAVAGASLLFLAAVYLTVPYLYRRYRKMRATKVNPPPAGAGGVNPQNIPKQNKVKNPFKKAIKQHTDSNWGQQECKDRLAVAHRVVAGLNTGGSVFLGNRLNKLTPSFDAQGMIQDQEVQARAFIAMKEMPLQVLQRANRVKGTAHLIALAQYYDKHLAQHTTGAAQLSQDYKEALAILDKKTSQLSIKSDHTLWVHKRITKAQQAEVKDIARRQLYLALCLVNTFRQTEHKLKTQKKNYQLIPQKSENNKLNPQRLLFEPVVEIAKQVGVRNKVFYPFARVFQVGRDQFVYFLGVKMIGEGAFNEAERGYIIPERLEAVYRRLSEKARKDQGAVNDWDLEKQICEVLKGLEHVVQVYHMVRCKDDKGDPRLGFLMQCCNGDLESLVQNSQISSRHRFDIFEGILKGVAGMHAKGYVHADLKLKNVLFKYDPRLDKYIALVSDFGMTKQASDKADIYEGGTIVYDPPVCFDPTLKTLHHPQNGVDTRAFVIDTWAIGLMALELKTGKPILDKNGNATAEWNHTCQLAVRSMNSGVNDKNLERNCYQEIVQKLNCTVDNQGRPQYFHSSIDHVIWNLLVGGWTDPARRAGGWTVQQALNYIHTNSITDVNQ